MVSEAESRAEPKEALRCGWNGIVVSSYSQPARGLPISRPLTNFTSPTRVTWQRLPSANTAKRAWPMLLEPAKQRASKLMASGHGSYSDEKRNGAARHGTRWEACNDLTSNKWFTSMEKYSRARRDRSFPELANSAFGLSGSPSAMLAIERIASDQDFCQREITSRRHIVSLSHRPSCRCMQSHSY